jgi:hypothetical protein
VNFSRRGFLTGAATVAGASAIFSPALAHGRKAKGAHRGRHSTHGKRRAVASAPEAEAAPVVKTAAVEGPTANLDTLRHLDPQGMIRKPLLAAALVAMERHHDRIADKSKIFIADFAQHSSRPRLYALDMTTGEVEAFRTAHGRGSDPDRSGWARRFSNAPGSYASSVGAYTTTGKAFGLRHGTHVGLEGLEASNNLARERAIVVHSAEYCESPFLRAFGMLGRSEGCFATSSKELAQLMPAMGEGRLLYAGI